MASLQDMYDWAVRHCNGTVPSAYSQSWRDEENHDGILYYDCSSFVNCALLAGDFDISCGPGAGGCFCTDTMIYYLDRAGWKEISVQNQHLPGDIGWNNDHTEICYASGPTQGVGYYMGAQNTLNGCAISTSTRTWTKLFRYPGQTVTVKSPSDYVLAAIAGNFAHESFLNPGAWESLTPRNWDSLYSSNTGGYGLGQWTNSADGSSMRLYNLYSWMTKNGYSMTDGDGQLAYLLYEDYWSGGTQYPTLASFLESTSTDLDDLVETWMIRWEGVSSGLSARLEYAHDFIDYIPDHRNDDVKWYAANTATTQEQKYQNLIRLVQNLSGCLPGDSSAPTDPEEISMWDITSRADVDPGYNAGTFDIVETDFMSMFLASRGSRDSKRKLHIKNRRR